MGMTLFEVCKEAPLSMMESSPPEQKQSSTTMASADDRGKLRQNKLELRSKTNKESHSCGTVHALISDLIALKYLSVQPLERDKPNRISRLIPPSGKRARGSLPSGPIRSRSAMPAQCATSHPRRRLSRTCGCPRAVEEPSRLSAPRSDPRPSRRDAGKIHGSDKRWRIN